MRRFVLRKDQAALVERLREPGDCVFAARTVKTIHRQYAGTTDSPGVFRSIFVRSWGQALGLAGQRFAAVNIGWTSLSHWFSCPAC